MPGIAGVFCSEKIRHPLQVLHEAGKALRVLACIGQTAGRNGLKQAPCGVAFVAKKPRVCQAKPQKCRLGVGNHLPDRRQQPGVGDQLLNHLPHHLNHQRLTHTFGFGFESLTYQRHRLRRD